MTVKFTKQAAYDQSVYLGRHLVRTAVSSAGASGTVGKWYVPRAMTLWGFGGEMVANGTSTYTITNTANGVVTDTTTHTNGSTVLTFYWVSGTTTTTYSGVNTVLIGTNTPVNIASAGTARNGVQLSAGDLLYALNGTDATATTIGIYEVSFGPNTDIGG